MYLFPADMDFPGRVVNGDVAEHFSPDYLLPALPAQVRLDPRVCILSDNEICRNVPDVFRP